VRIALFGGTFDPIHCGHLRVAEAAAKEFALDKLLFVPSAHPPHKLRQKLTAFAHRYAMVSLACASDPRFVPSLLEAPTLNARPQYTVDTCARAKRSLGARDRFFFLIGMDALLDLPQWKDYRRLLNLANFIVVSRPGFEAADIWKILPEDIVPSRQRDPEPRSIKLQSTRLYILRDVDVPAASHQIRAALQNGGKGDSGGRRDLTGFVPPLVEEYIRKEGLYRPAKKGKIQGTSRG